MFGVPDPNNLVQNGDFETGDLTGWTVKGAGTEGALKYTDLPWISLPQRGVYAAVISSNQPEYLSQAITLPAKQCSLSFQVARPQLANGFSGDVVSFTASIDGQIVADASTVQGTWKQFIVPFLGYGRSQILQFAAQTDDSWWLDDVSITCSGDNPFGSYGAPRLGPFRLQTANFIPLALPHAPRFSSQTFKPPRSGLADQFDRNPC